MSYWDGFVWLNFVEPECRGFGSMIETVDGGSNGGLRPNVKTLMPVRSDQLC